MRKLYIIPVLALLSLQAKAQVPGDTIVVSTLNYNSTSRDTFVQFPSGNYEKILMLYNMRCKNGLVSPGTAGQTNIGCGEWDYTCNTYVTDSSKKDSTRATAPSHIIPGFSGVVFNYRTSPTYNYYRYTQQQVNYTATISESNMQVGTPTGTTTSPFNTQYRTAKSQYLWTATELLAAGVTAGNITGFSLNVTNAGSAAQYLKVRMKATSQTALSAATPDLNGFTEVYFLNTSLVNGPNRLRFYNNFNWNGTDNILVEFSFTNAATGTNTSLSSSATPVISGLVSGGDDYNYDFTGTNMMKLGNGAFSTFSNQLSIGFWANGNPGFSSRGNSIVYASNPQGHRQANVHLPWSDLKVYWDNGSGGTYNRVIKQAAANDFENKWNYWVFTKNAATGAMNIYLNGVSWASGTGMTLPVVVTDFFVGSMPNNDNPFFGKMDELSLWNTELQPAEITAWMNRNITAAHPKYSNLLAYYKFNENGGTITDASAAGATATLTGAGSPVWNLHYGKDIFKGFTETSNRPVVSFIKGVYTQTTTPIVVTDSIRNNRSTVYSFTVQNNSIVPVDTNQYYRAGYTYVYDGTTNAIIDSVNNSSTGTINITSLPYYQKSPSAFQLVSFVTPYGINLNMGMNGKTWTFDVTDFGPVLKGWKRLYMNGGGEYQEQMDIKFLFIVGTPPRNVRDINNLWKVESVPYTNLLNDNKMEPRNLTLDPGASGFKIKTAITGHGQEGEFIARNHYININGGPAEFNWQVWKSCAGNPVYPQGGTWIYDRAGWCPGMATDVHESDISSYGAGSNIQIDYGITTASGASDYWVSNLLVNYGAANFTLDAAVIDVKNPSSKVEYARTNPMCGNPIVTIQNTGSTALTSLKIEYWINNNTVKQTYNWTGNLAFLEKMDVTLPMAATLWSGATGANNQFHVTVSQPNGAADQYSFNNTVHSGFSAGDVQPADIIVSIRTNAAAAETSYEVLNASGASILSRNNLSNNTTYSDTLRLAPGCYTFRILDSDDDGISFWNNNDGSGTARFVRPLNGFPIKTFQGDFGAFLEYNFSVTENVGVGEVTQLAALTLHPNPASNNFVIEGNGIADREVSIYNALGQQMQLPVTKQANKLSFNSSALTPGFYSIIVRDGKGGVRSFKLTKVD